MDVLENHDVRIVDFTEVDDRDDARVLQLRDDARLARKELCALAASCQNRLDHHRLGEALRSLDPPEVNDAHAAASELSSDAITSEQHSARRKIRHGCGTRVHCASDNSERRVAAG